MLLVGDHMTREVITTTPDATAAKVLGLCRERRIRHMPVVGENGRLVGMVSDRDLRSATPALGNPARSEALERITVSEAMMREVLTAAPNDPIEEAANEMRERSIGCLPVVDGGNLVGILTTSDVMAALVYLVGAHEPGSRLEIAMPDRPGSLAGVSGAFGELGVNIVAAATGHRREPPVNAPPGSGDSPWRVAVFRVDTIDPTASIDFLEKAGYEVIPPKPGA
ncbi:MAG: CBS and ACT domain-containing protein [Rubrobacteraceae bacterium]